eukprot:21227-Eustigmatos_ZCMA.PRE.1
MHAKCHVLCAAAHPARVRYIWRNSDEPTDLRSQSAPDVSVLHGDSLTVPAAPPVQPSGVSKIADSR